MAVVRRCKIFSHYFDRSLKIKVASALEAKSYFREINKDNSLYSFFN